MRRRVLFSFVGLALLVAFSALALYVHRMMSPGAGAAYQEAPDQVAPGETAHLTLRLAVWGAGGPANQRYHDVRLETRSGTAAQWSQLSASRIEADPKAGVTYHFEVPVPDVPGTLMRYRYSFVFDGQAKTLDGLKSIRIEVPSGSR